VSATRTQPPRPLAAILFGATASGKTALAVEAARHVALEIISADSRQIYRHLDVGTAKPTAHERAAVPHHLVDFLDLDATYSAARFTADALRLCAEIRARGRLPLIVGGAGFYLHVLREGLFDAPYSDDALLEVRGELESWSLEVLREELARRDPDRLAAIHVNDRYRLARALEICIASGSSVTALTASRRKPERAFFDCRLQIEREQLHRNIQQRTAAMLEAGWVEEVRQLLETFDASLPGFVSLGYPHVVQHLRGTLERDALADLVNRDTRRFARHQETWFRKMPAPLTLHAGDSTNVERLVDALKALSGL
jgi:tRNA dimethylallyltransferase